MKRSISFIAVLIFLSNWGIAQELNATVRVNYQNVGGTGTSVFEDMENAFSQFLSNRKWTDDAYSPEERINCNFIITIDQMPSVSDFTATVQVQSSSTYVWLQL